MVNTHFDLVSGPFWTPGGPKRARFGPKRSCRGPPRSLEGPGGPDLVPTALEWSDGVKLRVTEPLNPEPEPLKAKRVVMREPHGQQLGEQQAGRASLQQVYSKLAAGVRSNGFSFQSRFWDIGLQIEVPFLTGLNHSETDGC